ncbi:MAG: histidine--tRNA ligase [candidate division KSB1 bacterium]|nr:histidine--tRNA ligase [candidate division KSB1 bacterium]
MRYQSIKGTRDVLPDEQPYWRHIEAQIHRICALYGYERIDTPIFEQTQLFERGVGAGTDIVEKEMYTFSDRSQESLTLRPEFTAAVVRAYLQNGLHTRPKPVRLFSIGPIFRYERPQAGRFRQHTQFNVEALGEQDPAVDVEVMSIAWHLYAELGFRGLRFQLNSTGCPRCRPGYLEALRAYYQGHTHEICPDCQRRLERNPLRVLDCKVESCQPIIAGAPPLVDHLCEECATHFATLRQYLDLLGRPYTLNHRLVRGLDYYTKTVFEVWVEGIGAQNAMCGGGRYDGLIEQLGGPPTPGIGFGSGIERIILSMKEQGLAVPELPKPRVFVAYHGQLARMIALRVISSLRDAGVATTFAPGDRSLKAQLREANRLGTPLVVIVGEDEAARQTAAVKDMLSGTQQEVPLARLVEHIRATLASSTSP